MIINYLKIALRNLNKHKFISFINLFGLTVGLTCCLLITVYIIHELSYDRFNDKAGRIYRVTRTFNGRDGVDNMHLASVAPPFGPLLKNDFPDIQRVTRLYPNNTTAIKYGDKLFNERSVFYADEQFFNFFPVPVVEGSAATALSDPKSIMMTEELAHKYFGNEDPMNKMVKVDNQHLFKVTGVFKPFPSNAHFHPEILLSFSTLKDTSIYGEKVMAADWGNNSFPTYVMFPSEDYPVKNIESQLPHFIDAHVAKPPSAPDIIISQFTKIHFQKLTDIHLYSHNDDELEPGGDINRVYIFSAIALFILLIACINYMNLSTARSALRAREIGIRKVIGAQQKEIIAQFLSESVLLTYIALAFAALFTWLLLPYVNQVSGLHLTTQALLAPQVIIVILLLPLAVGLLSGIYPALFMSSFKPVFVLKGLMKIGKGNISFRQVLVVTQFSISIILIIATTIVLQQLNYMQNISLGYDRNQVVVIPYISDLEPRYESFKSELLQHPDVISITRTSRVPTSRLLDNLGLQVPSGDSLKPASFNLVFVSADEGFLPVFNVKMSAGRNFSKDYITDTTNFIVNDAAVAMFGWKNADHAIGKDIAYGGVKGKIIGVMNDFHFEDLHQPIIPLLLRMPQLKTSYYHYYSVRISGSNVKATMANIEKVWKAYVPELPFQGSFLNERYDKLYKSEEQQASIFTSFSFIAIFIACLGLFGLSAFIITQRFKEIGIRKVLGASISGIVKLLSVDFLKLVLISAIIATPIAWYMMHRWLQDFAYRIDISWWVFIFAALMAGIIAFATISFQAMKAALMNPVKSLRTE